ncbi:MAG: histidinol dehydrogenase [Deltaproteobacteria bacterium]|nr:histidinol dehydrogenase [Deltaproteobacteria bacterium]
MSTATRFSLRRLTPEDALAASVVRDRETAQIVERIIAEVRREGRAALERWARDLGDWSAGTPLVFQRDQLDEALRSCPPDARSLLERCAERVRTFAQAQRASLSQLRQPIPGGFAGHQVAAVRAAGCYAPGGRFPLPSSVLMTVVTARAAGVDRVWAASPKPTTITLAAAAIGGADGLLAAGGAQAIAALAFGVDPLPRCDVIVGPGNRFVTAAKRALFGEVGIDMLAGPTELLIIADQSADPELVAADLLAQAEHDVDARPYLATDSPSLLDAVERALASQLASLATTEIASQSLGDNGGVFLIDSLEDAAAIADQLAPEHLQLLGPRAEQLANDCHHFGGLFIGQASAEVLGDYCAGPNHTLPTAGSARFSGGLSVFDFCRVRTWLQITDRHAAQPLLRDAVALAELEGLVGHANAARRRLTDE